MNRRLLGALYASIASTIWGGMYVVTDVVLEVVPPGSLLVIRYALASVVLLAVFVLKRDRWIARRDLGEVVLTAFVGFGISLLAQFSGTELSTAAAGAVITSATPAFIILFAGPLLKEAPDRPKLAGLALATIGVLVVSLAGGQLTSDQSRDPLLGNLLLGVAAVTWALYTVMARRATRRYSSLVITLAVTAFGIPIVAPVAVIESQTRSMGTLTPAVLAGIAYVGFGSTAVAFYLWNKSFELLDAATASLFFFAQPVAGTLLSAVFLHEVLGLSFFAGAALIGLGVLLAMRAGDRGAVEKRRAEVSLDEG